MPYLRMADLLSSFLLIGVLFIISISLLFGVVKNREKYLIPFLSLQIMDFLLCLLTLLGSYIELPAYLKLARPRPGPSKVPLMTLQLLDFCLSILTLCSSYMEVPTYLNFKSMNHMNYLPSQEGVPHSQFINMMLIFSVAFITVLILKVYMFKCVYTCYKFLKHMNSAMEDSSSKMFLKVALPSYEEALSLPPKTPEGTLHHPHTQKCDPHQAFSPWAGRGRTSSSCFFTLVVAVACLLQDNLLVPPLTVLSSRGPLTHN